MAVPVEEAVLNALRGHLSENTKLPAPLIIKVYVAALKKGAYLLNLVFYSNENIKFKFHLLP